MRGGEREAERKTRNTVKIMQCKLFNNDVIVCVFFANPGMGVLHGWPLKPHSTNV